jgi:hypothetical protein
MGSPIRLILRGKSSRDFRKANTDHPRLHCSIEIQAARIVSFAHSKLDDMHILHQFIIE